MANEEHFKILKQGVKTWNRWREENPNIGPDLAEADLENLFKDEVAASIKPGKERTMFFESKGYGADLSRINLASASLWGARLQFVNLSGADLTEADLTRANLRYSNLSKTKLNRTRLYEADLYMANLDRATLFNTNLLRASLVSANLENAKIENCWIHGTSIWGVKLNEKTYQRDLIIFDPNDSSAPTIKVDDIEVAQFIYLLLDNRKIRNVIDTITSKVVLILGRFTQQRKAILDAIREELRKKDYLPVLF